MRGHRTLERASFRPSFLCGVPHGTVFKGMGEGRYPEDQGAAKPGSKLPGARGPGPDVSCAEAAPRLQVSVNGRHFLHYRYRLPLSRVDTLGIFGDILVKAVGFLNINVSSRGARAGVAVASDLL